MDQTTDATTAPVDNLIRSYSAPRSVELRDVDGEDGNTLFGHFSVFNEWYEVDSAYEGHFLERIAPERSCEPSRNEAGRSGALYDHGTDPQLGNKPLGPLNVLSEDKVGGYFEIGLIDTSYNLDFIKPAAEAGLLGSSFRFRVVDEKWHDPTRASVTNPDRLPERTISDVELYELGPVTFPANPAATAALRSCTDDYIDRLTHDPLFLARFTERVGLPVVERLLAGLPSDEERTEPLPPTEELEEDLSAPPVSVSTYTPTPRPRPSLDDLRADRAALVARVAAATIERTGYGRR